jgi:hypothetical protein
LMLYIVLGTLYNRYVLQLRGFDQLPQFSAESARYHAVQAMDWVRSGYEGWQGRGSVSLRDHHHDHLNGPAARTPDRTSPAPGNEFVRANNGARGSAAAGKQRAQPEPNPVSHFSQAQQQPSAGPAEPPTQSAPSRPKDIEMGSTKEEKSFLVGEDEDEDANEDITAAATASRARQVQGAATPTPASSTAEQPPAQGQTAAEMRGRVSGEGEDGKIRL